MSTKDLMLFTTRAKGRFRRTYNEEVKEVKVTKKNNSFEIKVTGMTDKVVNYDFKLSELIV